MSPPLEAPKTILVTAASSGIGLATATLLAASGHRVFGTSREAQGAAPGPFTMVPLDVCDPASVDRCIDAVTRAAGPIDALVSNAGQMVFGLVEEVAPDDARAMFETNFWGAVRVVHAVLPSMRARKCGHVVLVGSVAATAAIPMNGFYAASKAALGRYAEALRYEVAHLGVKVSLVEPSDYRTHLWRSARHATPHIADYEPVRRPVLAALGALRQKAPEPTPVAEAIRGAVESATPGGVYRVGAWARRLPRMRAWMPAGMFEAGVRRRFGLV